VTDEPIIYLAGPVAHKEDGGASWREAIKDAYANEPVGFRDPLSKYNVPAQDLTVVNGTSEPDDDTTVGTREIVEGDKELIDETDAVLVGYEPVRSIGTPMEVMYAFERDIPIGLWLRDADGDISPWYKEHVSFTVKHMTAGVNGLMLLTNEENELDTHV
jgi:nucleoside 2-deoxyribosyltransferase